jgi:type I restriction enzyme S subunit
MREGWKNKNIEEISKILNGRTPKTKIKEYWDGDIAWITPADLGKNKSIYVSNTSRKITKLGLEKSSAKLFPSNSIVLSTRAPIGHLAINTIEMSTNQGCRGIVPTKECDTKYLFYFLYSNVELLNNLGTGTTFKELSTKALATLSIPIPPLPEQKQIVAILDKAFAAIDQAKANIEKNIENVKELFQSKLNEIFSQKGEGWDEKKLGEVCEYDKSKHNGVDLPYVGLEHIESNTGKYLGDDSPVKVKSSTFRFTPNHVLYGRLRPYLNKVLLPNFYGHCSSEIFPILPKENLNRKYLYYWLMSPNIVKKINATWTGARMPRANMNEVINFRIYIPSIKIQLKLADDLESINSRLTELEEKYSQKLTAIDLLKKSILQKAFSGELTKDFN